MDHICIAVCTYRRRQHLDACLSSLTLLARPECVELSILVVDNDAEGSARETAKQLQISCPEQAHYCIEKRRGIPFARNRALDEALRMNANWIAFIDDDEQATPGWIVQLYQFAQKYPAQTAVHGRVIPVFPDNTPKYVRETFHSGKVRASGTELEHCATDNVLFPLSLTSELGIRFDESRPLAGGTDSLFFYESTRKGARIFECAEATVYETVFPDRLKLNWLISRKFRVGITIGYRHLQERGKRGTFVLSTSIKVSLYLITGILFGLFFRRTRRNKQFLKAARYAGIASGAMGMQVDSYAKIES